MLIDDDVAGLVIAIAQPLAAHVRQLRGNRDCDAAALTGRESGIGHALQQRAPRDMAERKALDTIAAIQSEWDGSAYTCTCERLAAADLTVER